VYIYERGQSQRVAVTQCATLLKNCTTATPTATATATATAKATATATATGAHLLIALYS
jgi:hypothetical protein